jgi:hypothetical protein
MDFSYYDNAMTYKLKPEFKVILFILDSSEIALSPVFYFSRMGTFRGIFFRVEVISSTAQETKKYDTFWCDTVELENRLKPRLATSLPL